jgi:hypothetical protein
LPIVIVPERSLNPWLDHPAADRVLACLSSRRGAAGVALSDRPVSKLYSGTGRQTEAERQHQRRRTQHPRQVHCARYSSGVGCDRMLIGRLSSDKP